MSKDNLITMNGVIISKLPHTMFKVQLENKHEILAHLSGKIRKNYVKILPGDTVKVEMTTYDLTKGRIVYRERIKRT